MNKEEEMKMTKEIRNEKKEEAGDKTVVKTG